jgi:energy-coupling factor transporter ATP-binding protein EcfA2
MIATHDDGRDDFPRSVVNALGGRAGYICSFPSCGRLTIGPSEDRSSRLSNVGVAAHITAASPKGPRFDPNITPEERASEVNGIWLCQLHGKLIDDNSSLHRAGDLRRWKQHHEAWVFGRLANAQNHVDDGLGYLLTEDIGPLPSAERLTFGRLTLVFGRNGAGKSTLCEAATAFAGEPHFTTFADRWDFTQGVLGGFRAIEAGLALGGVQTRVRILDRGVAGVGRIRIEVDGNVAPAWPRSLVRAVRLDRRLFDGAAKDDPLARAIEMLAHQFGLAPHVLSAALRDDVFASSIYRCTFRERQGELEVRTPEPGAGFLPPGNLSGSELRRLVMALALRMMEADPGPTPWLLCLDTGFFSGLDDKNKETLIQQLADVVQVKLQVVACVVFEKDVDLLRTARQERWIGAQRYGDLTVHSFL